MFANSQVPEEENCPGTSVKRLRLSLKSRQNRVITSDDSTTAATSTAKRNRCSVLTETNEEESNAKPAEVDDPKIEVSIASLKNLGNTCYLNSVLYCLLYIKEFRKIIHEAYVKLQITYENCNQIQFSSGSAEVVLQLHETFQQMIQIKSGVKYPPSDDPELQQPRPIVFNCTVLKPEKLLDSLREKNAIFEGNYQNDAHDALSCIMRCLETVDHDKPRKAAPRKQTSRSKIEGGLSNLFQGELLMKTKCLECENCSTTKEKFTEISIPSTCNNLDFETALKMEEILRDDDKYWCSICDHSNEAVRLCEYLRFPPVLTINLKPCYTQYSGLDGFQKLSTNSAVPELLPCLNDTCQLKPCHFTCYIRGSVMYDKMDNLQSNDGDKMRVTRNWARKSRIVEKMNLFCCDPCEGPTLVNDWVYFDDEYVSVVSKLPTFGGGISTQTPYLLFYRNMSEN